MRYLAHIRHLYNDHIKKKKEEPRFLILTSFTTTFIIARLVVYGLTNHLLSWPFGYFMYHGTHIHHIVYGVILLLVAGFIRIPQFWQAFIRLSSILYGIGAALVLDEFAMLIHFNPDVYFDELGKMSLDAVFVFFLLCLGFVWHGKFWHRVFMITFLHKKSR